MEEMDRGLPLFNQPSGHLEPNESLQEAALRETLEETGWHIELTGFAGIALYTSPHNGITYYRTTLIGKPLKQDLSITLDEGIIRAVWLDYQEVLAVQDRLRSPLVLKAIDQVRAGHCYPLDLIY